MMNNTWKVVLATLVIFVAGILTGAILVRSSVRLGQQRSRTIFQPANSQPYPNRPIVGQPAPTDNIRNPGNPAVGGNPPQGNNPNNPFPQLLRREFVNVLDRELQLTPEQHGQIERIINEGQERISQARKSIEPETRRALQETRERIHNTLTPEQRAQFEHLMKQRIQRRLEDPGNSERRPRDQRFQPPFRGPGNEPGGHPPRPEQPDEPPAHPGPPPPPAENP